MIDWWTFNGIAGIEYCSPLFCSIKEQLREHNTGMVDTWERWTNLFFLLVIWRRADSYSWSRCIASIRPERHQEDSSHVHFLRHLTGLHEHAFGRTVAASKVEELSRENLPSCSSLATTADIWTTKRQISTSDRHVNNCHKRTKCQRIRHLKTWQMQAWLLEQ